MSNFNTTSGKNLNSFFEGITKLLYFFIQLVAISSMFVLFYKGFHKLFSSFSEYDEIYSFLKDILHSLEILFIAPIPILITFAYKSYIMSIFPETSSKLNESKFINAIEAKQAFITSLIGITSTYLLGLFIELFTIKTPININSPNGPFKTSLNLKLDISNDFLLLLIFATIFLIIQIVLYKLISEKH